MTTSPNTSTTPERPSLALPVDLLDTAYVPSPGAPLASGGFPTIGAPLADAPLMTFPFSAAAYSTFPIVLGEPKFRPRRPARNRAEPAAEGAEGQTAHAPSTPATESHRGIESQDAEGMLSLANETQDHLPRPLRIMFCITSMPVGGAETLLVNLIRRLDRARFAPELCCLKELGPLGEELALEIPAHHDLLACKYDVRILGRLTRLFRERGIDAVVTVGAGDKMFWGRLAAWRAGVPVIVSALHSTGWPDGVGRLNRLLTPITDAFIGVAQAHGRHLIEGEGFPAAKVCVIPNGIDTDRFHRRVEIGAAMRGPMFIEPNAPVFGIVAALREEKNHELFLQAAAQVRRRLPHAHFLIVGDGPRRELLEALADDLDLTGCVHFLGSRGDVPEILSICNAFVLASHNEASPVSILEAMACSLPVVATRVGSVAESVREGETGFLVEPGNLGQLAERMTILGNQPELARAMGRAGREYVERNGSLQTMVRGYEELLTALHRRKTSQRS